MGPNGRMGPNGGRMGPKLILLEKTYGRMGPNHSVPFGQAEWDRIFGGVVGLAETVAEWDRKLCAEQVLEKPSHSAGRTGPNGRMGPKLWPNGTESGRMGPNRKVAEWDRLEKMHHQNIISSNSKDFFLFGGRM